MNFSASNLDPDPSRFESLVFRIHQEMNTEITVDDPLVADFVLIHSPMKLLLVVTAIIIVLKAGEEWMKYRNQYELRKLIHLARPAFFIATGLNFGMAGIGVMMAVVVTDGGEHLFQCVERSHLSLHTVICRYIVFVYFATLIYDLLTLILPILQKKQIPLNLIILRQLVWLGTGYVILKHHPIGYPVMIPFVHSLLKVLNNMLAVLETASKELKPDPVWHKRLHYLTVMLHILMVGHQVFFHSTSSCFPRWISSVVMWATVIQLTISMIASQRPNEEKFGT